MRKIREENVLGLNILKCSLQVYDPLDKDQLWDDIINLTLQKTFSLRWKKVEKPLTLQRAIFSFDYRIYEMRIPWDDNVFKLYFSEFLTWFLIESISQWYSWWRAVIYLENITLFSRISVSWIFRWHCIVPNGSM